MGSRLAVLLTTAALVGSPSAASGGAREVLVSAPSEAALGPPMVPLEVQGGRPSPPPRASAAERRAAGDDLEGLEGLEGLGDLAALQGLLGAAGGAGGGAAVLDTGASASVLSAASAARFGVEPEAGARYVEVGMTGEHAMGVSRPMTLALLPEGTPDARRARGRTAAPIVFRAQRLLLNEGGTDLASLLGGSGAAVDVVGMPAIADLVIELEPGEGLGGATVHLHERGARPNAALWLPLVLVDFNRLHHPKNRGSRPTVGENPTVPDVRTYVGAAETSGDWLLDTGSVVSVVSTATARALGLVGASGRPSRSPDFSLPVGGISGESRQLAGFHLDRIEIDTEDDRTLVLEAPAVLVNDVATVRDDGTRVVLDGILGMNLLLGSPGAAPFSRVVIDVDRERLGLTPRR